MLRVEVFVFSYNRGIFLKNCVESALKYIPNAKITIIDDNSTDKKTLEILNELPNDICIVKPKLTDNKRWGGFYKNINWVFQDLANNPWVVFIEDDMQFIRPFLKADLENINNYFKTFPNTACLSIDFFKEEHRELNKPNIIIDQKNKIYFLKDKAKAYRGGVHFNNPTIINIKRIREIGFEYKNDRKENRMNFEKSFEKMGFYAFPLLMYLPSPPTTKNKIRTITRKLVELYYQAGFYPYQEMSEEELARFLNRDISILPYTGDWLKTKMPSPGPPYVYADSMKMANRWMQQAEKLETLIRSKF